MVAIFDSLKKSSGKKLLLFLIIVFIAILGLVIRNRSNKERVLSDSVKSESFQKQSPLVVLNDSQKEKIPPLTKNDHIKGSLEAKVLLLVYTDFECPFCAQYHSTLSAILNDYPDDLSLVYRHYPIEDIHPNSRFLAEASECANELGGSKAFFIFVDKVFEEKEKLSDLNYAANSLNVNGSDLEKCLKSRRYKEKVEESYQEGLKAGIRVTPSTFIIKKDKEVWFIPGAYSYEDLKVLIEGILEE